MNWEVIVTVIGTVLGSQTLIELIRVIRNRRTDGRIEEAHADNEEFSTLRDLCTFLQQQLKDKEERFADQTQLVRKLNTEVIQLTKEKAEAELEQAKQKATADLTLEKVRCEDLKCPWRQPPNAHTGPKPSISKDKYHQQKKSACEE